MKGEKKCPAGRPLIYPVHFKVTISGLWILILMPSYLYIPFSFSSIFTKLTKHIGSGHLSPKLNTSTGCGAFDL